ncbi:unnamed protein product, partial [Heligmosomoides polygyrus]|uniref:Reverse transcriptase domain-containing protein n=1 Tax=Heligmosomoides polygyrus TaxID=6339 RepID=A0A183GX92_HELPZ
MESFDVTALYTNVPKDSALQAVWEILTEFQTGINLYGLTIVQLMTLINECLTCNVFKWFVPAHLPNTHIFLEKLRRITVDEEVVMESFDVTALYTNVPKDSALQAVWEILTEFQTGINLYGLTIVQLMTLINECLTCNVFKWSGDFYKQIRGLAMGQRLAPVLAVAFMSKVEAPVLERGPIFYSRYIDDCFVVCSTQVEMDACFELLNKQSEYIRLTRETPSNDWLPFLNVQVAVTILARESDVSARKTLEALWIASRNPKINRKDECVAVTQELAPFVGLSNFSRLVMEALSLRQKVVLARQALHFLRRCQRNDVIPTFITSKKLHETCGLPKDDKKLRGIENDILKMTIKSKQNHLYSLLLKCVSKEQSCERFLPDRLWRRIV